MGLKQLFSEKMKGKLKRSLILWDFTAGLW